MIYYKHNQVNMEYNESQQKLINIYNGARVANLTAEQHEAVSKMAKELLEELATPEKKK